MSDQKRQAAIFWDIENTGPGRNATKVKARALSLLSFIRNKGFEPAPHMQRVYARQWGKQCLPILQPEQISNTRSALSECGFQLVYSVDIADDRLIKHIDRSLQHAQPCAMPYLCVLVTADDDFIPAVERLHEQGHVVWAIYGSDRSMGSLIEHVDAAYVLDDVPLLEQASAERLRPSGSEQFQMLTDEGRRITATVRDYADASPPNAAVPYEQLARVVFDRADLIGKPISWFSKPTIHSNGDPVRVIRAVDISMACVLAAESRDHTVLMCYFAPDTEGPQVVVAQFSKINVRSDDHTRRVYVQRARSAEAHRQDSEFARVVGQYYGLLPTQIQQLVIDHWPAT